MPNVTEKTIETNTSKPNKLAKETKVLEKKPEPEKSPEKVDKKTRAPRARKIEELILESTKKMTDKEKEILIKYLKDENCKLGNQINELKTNIESAFKKVNQIQEQYNAMEKFYQDNLAYIDGQVVAFANAVRRSTVGGNN